MKGFAWMRHFVSMTGIGLVALGCGPEPNAILEVELLLPPRAEPSTTRFAYVQFRRADGHPFELDWERSDRDGVELSDVSTPADISIFTTEPNVDVHLRIRFCQQPTCGAIGDDLSPELWYALEQPFYEGHRTSWGTTITDEPMGRPTAPEVVDRCMIRGCVDGETSTYCDLGGRHFCEQ
jgi:hypothetical protein